MAVYRQTCKKPTTGGQPCGRMDLHEGDCSPAFIECFLTPRSKAEYREWITCAWNDGWRQCSVLEGSTDQRIERARRLETFLKNMGFACNG